MNAASEPPGPKPRLYLSGEIWEDCWRHHIVGGLYEAASALWAGEGWEGELRWPELDCGSFVYTGPYWMPLADGVWPSPFGTRAELPDWALRLRKAGVRPRPAFDPRAVGRLCRDSVARSDVVFARVGRGGYGAKEAAVEAAWAKGLGKTVWASGDLGSDTGLLALVADEVVEDHHAAEGAVFARWALSRLLGAEVGVEPRFPEETPAGQKLRLMHEVFRHPDDGGLWTPEELEDAMRLGPRERGRLRDALTGRGELEYVYRRVLSGAMGSHPSLWDLEPWDWERAMRFYEDVAGRRSGEQATAARSRKGAKRRSGKAR